MTIRIEEVTLDNRKEAEGLQVYEKQKGYIESVQECMQEADALDAWHPVCLYDGDTMIGFSMYGYIKEPSYTRLWFDRLLIDYRYQGKGYGNQAFEAVFKRIRKQYPDLNIYLSVYDDNVVAIHMYEKHGFVFTNELDTKGEKIMKFDIHKERGDKNYG